MLQEGFSYSGQKREECLLQKIHQIMKTTATTNTPERITGFTCLEKLDKDNRITEFPLNILESVLLILGRTKLDNY